MRQAILQGRERPLLRQFDSIRPSDSMYGVRQHPANNSLLMDFDMGGNRNELEEDCIGQQDRFEKNKGSVADEPQRLMELLKLETRTSKFI